jgi:hypothetical protein
MRTFLKLLLALFVLALAGCAQVLGPQTLTWSEADVNAMLAKRFPMDRRVLELLDVNVTQPAVKLLPGTNRLATDVHIQAVDRMFGSVFHGRITMESGLRYEPADHTIRLVDVRLGNFSLDKTGTAPRVPLQRLGAALVESILDDAVIHRVSDEKLARIAQFGYQPETLHVTDRGLELTVVPKRDRKSVV